MSETDFLSNGSVSAVTNDIRISVLSEYADHNTHDDTYQFIYHINIANESLRAVQLLDRHWIITDLEFEITHVKGDGVIGLQPVIKPGEKHAYSSFTLLRSPTGTMEGTYGMVYTDKGELFDVVIPRFNLYAADKIN